MAAKYQAYPEYKDSGVEWLGEIPKHWEVIRVKESAKVINGYPFDSSKFDPINGIPLVRIRDINSNKTEVYFNGYVPEEALINDNDILIGMDGDFNVSWWKSGIAALNQRVACVRLSDAYLKKLVYYALPFNMKVVNDLTYFTTVKHLSSTDILKTKYALPFSEEIESIIKFLDYEVSKIDTLIEKQQQLISLLKEKRQAVISHAVTKGLNPDLKMKDSGVEWLGEVPEHWEVKRLKYVCCIENNLRTPIDQQTRSEMLGDYPYYGPTGVLSWLNKFSVEGTYFLLGEDGDHFLKFKDSPMTFIVSGKFNVNNHAHLIKGSIGFLTEWGCLFFEVLDLSPWLIKQGVSRYKLRKESLVEIPVLVPPLDEQRKIIEYIKSKKHNFNLMQEKTLLQIQLLQERRTALISAAVTGKIDVRGWQPTNQAESNTTPLN